MYISICICGYNTCVCINYKISINNPVSKRRVNTPKTGSARNVTVDDSSCMVYPAAWMAEKRSFKASG